MEISTLITNNVNKTIKSNVEIGGDSTWWFGTNASGPTWLNLLTLADEDTNSKLTEKANKAIMYKKEIALKHFLGNAYISKI